MKRKIEADKYVEREICNHLKIISCHFTSCNLLIDIVILEIIPIIFQNLLKILGILLRSSRNHKMVEGQKLVQKWNYFLQDFTQWKCLSSSSNFPCYTLPYCTSGDFFSVLLSFCYIEKYVCMRRNVDQGHPWNDIFSRAEV